MASIQLPPGIAELVRATGQPQTVTAVELDDQGRPTGTSEQVVFLDGEAVRSVASADWPAAQAELATREQQRQQAIQLRQTIITTAQTAVGRPVNDLTDAQRRALIVALLWKAGALNRDGTVRALSEWL